MTQLNGHAQNRLNGSPSLLWDHSARDLGTPTHPKEGYDRFSIPHVLSFASNIGSYRGYYKDLWDEALRVGRQDALVMENDVGLMGPLNERMLAAASLPGHVHVPDEKDPRQKQVQQHITKTLEGMVGPEQSLLKLRMNLLWGLWFGRQGAKPIWDWQRQDGIKTLYLADWSPVRGDKIAHLKDGTPTTDVYPGVGMGGKDAFPGADITPSTNGAYQFALHGNMSWGDRQRMLIHAHELIDRDFFDAEGAEAAFGSGIRSRVFWLDWVSREWLAATSTFVERVGLGITIWYYRSGNDAAKKAAEKGAREQGNRSNILVPLFGDEKMPAVERVEVPTNGAELLLRLRQDIREQQMRYIIGQTMSTGGSKDTGGDMGGSHRAAFASETKDQIRNYDARNLDATLTGSMMNPGIVSMIQYHTFPWSWPSAQNPDGFRASWVSELEEGQDSQKVESGIKLVSQGVEIKADELRSAAGYGKPQDGDEIVSMQQPGMDPNMPAPEEGAPEQGGGRQTGDWLQEQGPRGGEWERNVKTGTRRHVAPKGQEGPVPSSRPGSPERYQLLTRERLREAAAAVHREPSDAQKDAGNYRKGHVYIQGLDITIEIPKGGTRSGRSKAGKEWSVTMPLHYGYVRRTESAADGDNVDVMIGPDPESEVVYVVDQLKPSGRFDEHKCLIGFYSAKAAKEAYLSCYEPRWKGFGGMTALTMPQFKRWLEAGDTGVRLEGQEVYSRDGWVTEDTGCKLAQAYAELFNEEGDEIPEDQLEAAGAILGRTDWVLHWDGEKWVVHHAEEGTFSHEQEDYARHSLRAPKGGVHIGGRFYRGGQFIPSEFTVTSSSAGVSALSDAPKKPAKAAPMPSAARKTPKPAQPEGDISGALGGFGKGMVDSLYGGLFDSLQKGKDTFAGVPDPALAKAKPFFEQGLLKSPDDLRRLVNAGYDPAKAGLAKAAPTPPAQAETSPQATPKESALDRLRKKQAEKATGAKPVEQPQLAPQANPAVDAEHADVEAPVEWEKPPTEMARALGAAELGEREQSILSRLWLEGMTGPQVGDEFGVSRQRIKQIADKAVGKLRAAGHTDAADSIAKRVKQQAGEKQVQGDLMEPLSEEEARAIPRDDQEQMRQMKVDHDAVEAIEDQIIKAHANGQDTTGLVARLREASDRAQQGTTRVSARKVRGPQGRKPTGGTGEGSGSQPAVEHHSRVESYAREIDAAMIQAAFRYFAA